jgi:hypothetical protein
MVKRLKMKNDCVSFLSWGANPGSTSVFVYFLITVRATVAPQLGTVVSFRDNVDKLGLVKISITIGKIFIRT